MTREIQAHAESLALAEDPQALLLFAADENYNPGVVGLAASRLVEQYYRRRSSPSAARSSRAAPAAASRIPYHPRPG